MTTLVEFLTLSDANVRAVVIGSVLLGASSAVVGCFTFLRKRALVGDAVAHAVLPGVCISFIFLEWLRSTGLAAVDPKHPLALIAGAFVSSWLALAAIDLITSRSRIKEDTAIGLTLSVAFGIGILLLTAIQHSGSAAQSGLDHFLFGNAAALVGRDLIVFGTVGALLVLSVMVFFKEFSLLAFDREYAISLGLPTRMLELLLTTLTVLAVVVGIQAVGVVLMTAMLITPPTAARYWTDRLPVMIVLAALLGAIAGIGGAFVSYLQPRMPTGPWIVMIISVIALLSLMFAPRRGVLARYRRHRRNRLRIAEENILKAFFHLGERDSRFNAERSPQELLHQRPMQEAHLLSGLARLRSQGYAEKRGGAWLLTPEGIARGQRITRLHRLWEVYLTRHVRIAPDHVHDDAETIEHIITPELEHELETVLDNPALDPHARQIPLRR